MNKTSTHKDHRQATSATGQTDNGLEGTPITLKIPEEATERIVSRLNFGRSAEKIRAL